MRAGGKRSWALLVGLAATLIWASPVAAQQQDEAGAVGMERYEVLQSSWYMFTLRWRAIHVPDLLLDAFYDQHTGTWDEGHSNYAWGAEFVWRKRGEYELGFALEWADLSSPAGFWLEEGEPAADARWTQNELSLLSLVFTYYTYWDATDWLSPYLGFGLGPGLVLGDFTRHDVVEGSACQQGLGQQEGRFAPPECFEEGTNQPAAGQVALQSPDVADEILPIIPVASLVAGLRFNIWRFLMAKVEVGFHNYLFAGAHIGAQF